MELCLVPAGPFQMGPGPNKGEEEYEHTLPYDYRIGRYPVTVGQFKEFVAASGFESLTRSPKGLEMSRWPGWVGPRPWSFAAGLRPSGGRQGDPVRLDGEPAVGA